MVALHGIEQGKVAPRSTTDADLVFNVRLVGYMLSDFAQALEDHGYTLEGIDAEGVGHRFSNGTVFFDVLAPDGVGGKAKLRTVGTAHTVQVPGGTQAIARTEQIEVEVGRLQGLIPRPNLLGAILVKARAVDVDDVPSAQLEDLAFLLSLVSDPEELRVAMKPSERRWLVKRIELAERDARTWGELASEAADMGFATFRILSEI